MAAAKDIVVQNSASSKTFYFRCVELFRPKKSQGVISIPLINTTATNNVLFRFMGQEEEVTITFGIFDDDTDVSNGTHGSTVKTVAEQIQYLKDTIFSEEYDTSWTLWDTHDLVYPSSSAITVVLTDLDFEIVGGAATFVIGSCKVKRGRIGFTS